MKQWIKTYIPYVVIGICLFWIIKLSFNSPNIPHKEIIHTTDTVIIKKTDTIKLVSPRYVTKHIVDTFVYYIDSTKSISFPIEQKYYKEEGRYEAWISGIQPKLDQINVFNKTEYKTVTNTVYKNRWEGYLFGQISTLGNKVIPTIGLNIKTPESLLFGFGVGLYENNPVYSVSLGYSIFKSK